MAACEEAMTILRKGLEASGETAKKEVENATFQLRVLGRDDLGRQAIRSTGVRISQNLYQIAN